MLSPCSLMEVGVTLTLAESESIVEGALSAARRLKIKVCVAVCNRQGRPIALSCMDGTYAEAGRAAIGKAVASASTGQPSGEIRGIPMHPSAGLVVAEGMPVLRKPGGLPISRDAEIDGGCGVAGAESDDLDEICARAGIAALNGRPNIKTRGQEHDSSDNHESTKGFAAK
jgi:glc operon protein GlcG